MRRILLYVILLIQILIITAFVFQFERIDVIGAEIKVTTKEKSEHDVYDFPLDDDAYVEYDISSIPEEKWSGSSNLKYGEKVYVLLEKGKDGIYEVIEGSHKKMNNTNVNSIVVLATYGYYNETEKLHEVNYKFQHLNKINRFGSFNYHDNLIVTLKVTKWGQYKVIDIFGTGK